MPKSFLTVSAEQARERLRSVGFMITRDLLVEGIRQKQIPIGAAIDTNSETRCIVYVAQLERFIAENLCEDTVPEIPREEASL